MGLPHGANRPPLFLAFMRFSKGETDPSVRFATSEMCAFQRVKLKTKQTRNNVEPVQPCVDFQRLVKQSATDWVVETAEICSPTVWESEMKVLGEPSWGSRPPRRGWNISGLFSASGGILGVPWLAAAPLRSLLLSSLGVSPCVTVPKFCFPHKDTSY